VFDMQFIKV